VISNPYAFRFFPSAEQEGKALAEKAFSSGMRKMALLTLQEEWQVSLSEQFKRVFERLGGEVVHEDQLTGSESDLSSYATSIKQISPDGILVNLTIGQIGTAVKKIREQGLGQPLYSNYRVQYKENLELAGSQALEGLVFFEVDPRQPRFQALLSRQVPACGSPAICFVCYSAMRSFLAALEASPKPTRESVYEALATMRRIKLLDGELEMINREAHYKLTARVMKSGRAEYLE
jgi:branched-chain amino acid transport system substrate-binding protein